MATSSRLPPRSEFTPVFAACVFPVFSWSIVWFFQKTPGWLPYLTVGSVLGIFAYTQAFALLESLFVLLLVVALAAILPRRWFRARFVAQGSALVFAATFWVILFQLIFESVILHWTAGEFCLWFGLALASTLAACILTGRSPRLARAVSGLADRLSVFLYLYVPLGLLGTVVVLARNLL